MMADSDVCPIGSRVRWFAGADWSIEGGVVVGTKKLDDGTLIVEINADIGKFAGTCVKLPYSSLLSAFWDDYGGVVTFNGQ